MKKGSITAAVLHHAYKQYSETHLAMQATFLWISFVSRETDSRKGTTNLFFSLSNNVHLLTTPSRHQMERRHSIINACIVLNNIWRLHTDDMFVFNKPNLLIRPNGTRNIEVANNPTMKGICRGWRAASVAHLVGPACTGRQSRDEHGWWHGGKVARCRCCFLSRPWHARWNGSAESCLVNMPCHS